MSEKKYYCFCGSNCRYETMTKEQILAAIAEATGVAVAGGDAGFITKVKETNGGGYVTFWVGTQEQYNALQTYEKNCMYIVTDETTGADFEKAIAAAVEHIQSTGNPHNVTAAQAGAVPAGYIENRAGGDEQFPSCSTEEELEAELLKALNSMGSCTVKTIGLYLPNMQALGIVGGVALVKLFRASRYLPMSASAEIEAVTERGVRYAVKRLYEGDWSPIEWKNPPMTLGVEYRTTERWQEKPVYTKLVSVGQLPATTGNIHADYHEDWEAVHPIRCSGYLDDHDSTLPQLNGQFEAIPWATHNTVYVSTKGEPQNQYEAFVQVWYVKY